ncbi:hypothetical protein AB1Y20_010323 [Prymnesium parvum]|uniref:Ubiquinol oxidase n=1 Tax=Prymnesium parvum TaxID=97485 RepID=A0AB34K6T3_PRYPA
MLFLTPLLLSLSPRPPLRASRPALASSRLRLSSSSSPSSPSSSPSASLPTDLHAHRRHLLDALEQVETAIRAEGGEILRPPPSVGVGTRRSVYEPSYGYLSKSAGSYVATDNASPLDGRAGPPSSALDLAVRSFLRECVELTRALWGKEEAVAEPKANGVSVQETLEAAAFREELAKLELSNEAIWERERQREQVDAPLVLKLPYYVLCYALDIFFDGRPIARFWFLETVARIPYFSYISMLHLYESLGWWRRSAETKQVHFAEEWNEFHHLLIMESLGGDQRWADRFLARHAAILYYWLLIFLWIASPTLAYNFSELIEAHAVDTYAEFVDANAPRLRALPAPRIARLYYEADDLHYFDEFQTVGPRGARRPRLASLYDVFSQVRDDEAAHVGTMAQCQDAAALVRAPRAEAFAFAAAGGAAAARLLLETPADTLAAKLLDGELPVEELQAAAGEGGALLEAALEPISDALEALVAFFLTLFESGGLS